MKKILITGPESTGKSSLAKALAESCNTRWVPEYARLWLEQNGADYQEGDLLQIAKGQLHLEDFHAAHANEYLFCDTGMLVMKVWSEFKYGRCHPWILDQWAKRSYDYYLLCGIDTPWEADPFRENQNERAELFAMYQAELEVAGKQYITLIGSLRERLEIVRDVLSI